MRPPIGSRAVNSTSIRSAGAALRKRIGDIDAIDAGIPTQLVSNFDYQCGRCASICYSWTNMYRSALDPGHIGSMQFLIDVGCFPSVLMPPIPRRLAPIDATTPPGTPASRSRRLLTGMSWGLAATALASPALHHVWHAAASSAGAHSSLPAFVAATCFSLAVAFFTSAPINACTWDDHLTKAIAHVFAFALWALGFVMVCAVYFN